MDASLIATSLIASHARSSTSIEHGHGNASEQKGPSLHDGVRMNDDRWAFPPQPPAWPPAPSATPPRRTSRTLAAIALFVATGVVAAGIGVGGVLLVRHVQGQPTSNSPTAGSGTSSGAAEASALYQQAVTATGASTGFHYVPSRPAAMRRRSSGMPGQANGRQAITFDSDYGDRAVHAAPRGHHRVLPGQYAGGGRSARCHHGHRGDRRRQVGLRDQRATVRTACSSPGSRAQSQAEPDAVHPGVQSAKVTGSGGVSGDEITGVVPASANVPAGTGTLLIASSSDLPITYTSSSRPRASILDLQHDVQQLGNRTVGERADRHCACLVEPDHRDAARRPVRRWRAPSGATTDARRNLAASAPAATAMPPKGCSD